MASLLPTAASRRCVHRVVRSSLLGAHRAAIEAEVEPLLRADDHAALRQLYERLRCLPDGVSHIESVLRRRILSTAADALGAVEEARGDGGEAYVSAFVAAALAVHDRFEALIHEVFDEDDGPDGGRGGSAVGAVGAAPRGARARASLNAAAGGCRAGSSSLGTLTGCSSRRRPTAGRRGGRVSRAIGGARRRGGGKAPARRACCATCTSAISSRRRTRNTSAGGCSPPRRRASRSSRWRSRCCSRTRRRSSTRS